MPNTITLITYSLALISGLLLIRPFLSTPRTLLEEGEAANEQLIEQKERILAVLRDLELDSKTQKISEEDYSRSQASLTRELASVLKKLGEI